jgi:hypothetical protein
METTFVAKLTVFLAGFLVCCFVIFLFAIIHIFRRGKKEVRIFRNSLE